MSVCRRYIQRQWLLSWCEIQTARDPGEPRCAMRCRGMIDLPSTHTNLTCETHDYHIGYQPHRYGKIWRLLVGGSDKYNSSMWPGVLRQSIGMRIHICSRLQLTSAIVSARLVLEVSPKISASMTWSRECVAWFEPAKDIGLSQSALESHIFDLSCC